MKTVLLFATCVIFASLNSKATIHIVEVSNNQFSPGVISNVTVGDTVRWQWVQGFHTTTCDPADQGTGNSLPAGAATWNSTISSSSPTFDYKVTVAGTYNYWCVPHAPEMAGSFTAADVLPVSLSSLIVNGNGEKVTLSWKTFNEANTDYFVVYRSENGSDYKEIEKIQAAGNSTVEKAYSFIDTKISDKQKFYYYNIAVVDKDGRQQRSETKLFKNTLVNTPIVLSLSPNPIKRSGHLMLTFNAEKEGNMSVKVINSEGRIVVSTNMKAYTGINKGHLHLGTLPAGTYTLLINTAEAKETHRILVN